MSNDGTAPHPTITPIVAAVKRTVEVHSLELIHGGPVQRFLLDRPELILGRAAEADLRMESGELSRQHAVFRRKDGEFSCEDLQSTHGIFLNGLKVHAAVLRDGDVLQMGDLIFVYREGA